MNTVGAAISRIKNSLKAVKQDAASLSNRFLYSLILKHGKFLLRRQDNQNKLMMSESGWKTLNVVELETVDKTEAAYEKMCLLTGCNIQRTKDKLPGVLYGYYGPLVRRVTSLDGSTNIELTTQVEFERMIKQPNFKYNKTKYYWIENEYLYFPNIVWDAIKLQGMFEGDTSKYNSDNEEPECIYIQDTICPIPEYLFSEIEKMIKIEDIQTLLQIPPNMQHDNVNVVE